MSKDYKSELLNKVQYSSSFTGYGDTITLTKPYESMLEFQGRVVRLLKPWSDDEPRIATLAVVTSKGEQRLSNLVTSKIMWEKSLEQVNTLIQKIQKLSESDAKKMYKQLSSPDIVDTPPK